MKTDLERYRVFDAVVRAGSLSQAAKLLYTSQPAVSRNIALLEETLGCQLFHRTARGMTLTPAGQTLHRYVSEGLRQFSMGENQLSRMRNLDSGLICVGASDMTLKYCLLPYLEEFHGLYPGVQISVTNGPTPETLELLRQGRIDFGLVTEPVPEEPELERRPVGQLQDIFIAGSRFGQLRGRLVSLQELAGFPFVCLEQKTSTRFYVDRFCAEAGVRLTPEFELATSDLIVQFTQRNLGVGSVVEAFARQALEDGSVFRIHLERELPPRKILLISRAERMSEAARRLCEQIP